MSEKLHSIQWLRAIAALGVALFHLSVAEQAYSPYRTLSFMNPSGQYGVDLFFVISGFVITYTSWHKIGQRRALKSYLWQRFSRIYPLYWIMTAILIIWFTLTGSAKNLDILASLLLIGEGKNLFLGAAWTLVFEQYFYLVFGLLFIIGRHAFFLFIGAWAFMAFSSHAPVISSPLVFEFLGGTLIAWWYLHFPISRRVAAILLGIGISYVLAVYIPPAPRYFEDALEPSYRVMIACFPMMCLVMACLGIEKLFCVNNSFARVMNLLGNASYAIYLSHMLTIGIMRRITAMLLPAGEVWHVIGLVVTTGAILVAGILCHFLVEKPMLRWCRRLSEKVKFRKMVEVKG